jgi:phytoene/squalene synthetase
VLHAFQQVVTQYNIECSLIEAFLNSMQMDLSKADHTEESYKNYIYGSSEVVGLMCLRVFCNNNRQQYDKLKSKAQSLGAAFQKINFLRDMRSDYEERGRTYFPGVNFNSFCCADKQSIEADIQKDFESGLEGIRELPVGVRKGVYVAYVYYYELFKKIKNIEAETVVKERIRVSDKKKIWLLAKALVKNKLQAI